MDREAFKDIHWFCCGWACTVVALAVNSTTVRIDYCCKICQSRATRHYSLEDGRFLEKKNAKERADPHHRKGGAVEQ